MKKLSVENFVCIVCMKFEDETVGTVVSSNCETSRNTTHCHDEQGNGNNVRKFVGERMMSNGKRSPIEYKDQKMKSDMKR